MFYRLVLLLLLSLPYQVFGQFGRTKTARAVIVGISNYENAEIPDLRFAHRDAQAFYDYLISPAGGNVQEDNIQLLIDQNATGGNVHKALYWLIKEAQEGDKSIIYFSGHGDVETIFADEPGHLLVYDSPNTIYQINSLRIDDLKRIVNTLSQAKRSKVTVYTDACRSGKLAGSGVKGPQATAAALTSQFSDEVKIMSCQPNEFSIEGEQWGEGRGLFSYFLIKGLTGLADADQDLAVNLKELQRYLEDSFDEELTDVQQTPVTVGDKNQLLSYVDESALAQIDPAQYAIADEMIKSPQGSIITSDSLLQRFYDALSSGILLNEKNSATHYYELILEDQSLQNKQDIIKGDLIAALSDNAMKAINQYLGSDLNELKKRYDYNDSNYLKYADYLEKASELLGPVHYLFPQMKTKSIYFSVVAQRLNLEKLQSEKDSYNDLINQLEDALKFENRSAFIYNELGLLNMNIENYDEALNMWDKAIELSPQWALPYANKSHVYILKKEFDESIHWASLAINISPDFTSPYSNLAAAYLAKGNLEQAINYTKKALSLDPGECAWLNNLGFYHFFFGPTFHCT